MQLQSLKFRQSQRVKNLASRWPLTLLICRRRAWCLVHCTLLHLFISRIFLHFAIQSIDFATQLKQSAGNSKERTQTRHKLPSVAFLLFSLSNTATIPFHYSKLYLRILICACQIDLLFFKSGRAILFEPLLFIRRYSTPFWLQSLLRAINQASSSTFSLLQPSNHVAPIGQRTSTEGGALFDYFRLIFLLKIT